MKKKILIILLSLVTALCLAFGLVACSDKDSSEGAVPTYQGMTITNSVSSSSAATTATEALAAESAESAATLSAGVTTYQDSRHGWKDYDGYPHYDFRNEDENYTGEDVEDIVDIDVVTDSEVRYYVQAGEEFILVVHLSNPSNYIIQSFTLNGKIYANYMFEDGSDMETLYLKVTAPTTPGYTEYTIDAIKYIDSDDDNAIKDAEFAGDKTIKAGVAYTSEPTATASVSVGTTAASLTVTLTDSQGVLDDYPVNLYVTDGESVIYTSALKTGENSISLSGLTMGTSYQYGVGTYYDMVDGNGVREHWLLTGSFTTQKAFSVTSASIYQTQIEFTITQTGNIGEITAVQLIDSTDNSVVASLEDFTQTWFTGLLSDHTYKITISFTYQLDGKTIPDSTTISFTTAAKTAPTVEIVDVTATQTEIEFALDTTDTDGILNITSVELYKDGEWVQSLESFDELVFSGLLSDNEYEIVVTYSYDLNDGMGTHDETATATVTTQAKAVPTVEVDHGRSDR